MVMIFSDRPKPAPTQEELEAKRKEQEMKQKEQEKGQQGLLENMKKIAPDNRCPACGGLGGTFSQNVFKKCSNVECENGYVPMRRPPNEITHCCIRCNSLVQGSNICQACKSTW